MRHVCERNGRTANSVQIEEKFGLLTVTKAPWSEPQKGRGTNWFCLVDCSCGTTGKKVWVKQLLCVGTVSCGCEKRRVHQSVAFKGRGK